MFDFLRDLRKSEEERRQEALSAYLDNVLTPTERQRFEQQLASDDVLRAELEEQRLIKASMSRLPRMRAPRNFTLDPALYGRPVAATAARLYPVMRMATAVVAIMFVLVLVLDLGPFGGFGQGSMAEAPVPAAESEIAEAPAAAEEADLLEQAAERAIIAEEEIEVSRVVEAEEAVEEPAAEEPLAMEAPAEEAATTQEYAADAVAEEAAAAEVEAEEAPPLSPDEVTGGGGPAEGTPTALITAPIEEGMAAEETEPVEGRAAGEATRPLIATAQAMATALASEQALTKEASSQPVPTSVANLFASPDEDAQATGEAVLAESTAVEPEMGLSTLQILAITLGLALIVLLVVTLLLRWQAR